MSSTWLRSTSYHTPKSEVLFRSTPLTSSKPRPTTTKPINPTPHPSTQDAPPNPPSHHPPHHPHSRMELASATTAEHLHNRLQPSSSKRNLRHIHRPRDVQSMRQRPLHMRR